MQAVEDELHRRGEFVLVVLVDFHMTAREIAKSFHPVEFCKVRGERHVVSNLERISRFKPSDNFAVFRIVVGLLGFLPLLKRVGKILLEDRTDRFSDQRTAYFDRPFLLTFEHELDFSREARQDMGQVADARDNAFLVQQNCPAFGIADKVLHRSNS